MKEHDPVKRQVNAITRLIKERGVRDAVRIFALAVEKRLL